MLARAGLPIEQSTSVQVLAAAHNTNPTMAPLGFIGWKPTEEEGNSGDAPTPANATQGTDSNKGTSHLAFRGSFCNVVVLEKRSLKKVKKYALTKGKPCVLV